MGRSTPGDEGSESSSSSDNGGAHDSDDSDGDEAIQPLKCGRAGAMQVGKREGDRGLRCS